MCICMSIINFLKAIAFALLTNAAILLSQDINSELIKNSGSSENYPGSNILILYDSTISDVRESGLSYVTMHKLTKILTNEGAKSNRNVVFGYDPLSADIEIKFARIYRKSGRIEIIDSSRFYDYPAPARMIYWGAREKTIDFGRLEPGDAIEIIVFRKGFTYALLADDDDRFIPPMRGHFYDIVDFWSSVPVIEKVYKVLMPPTKNLQYEVYNGEVKSYIRFAPEQDKKVNVRINPHKKEYSDNRTGLPDEEFNKTGKTIYCWSKSNIMPFKSEPNMVSPSDVAPKLLLSTSPDWYAKAVWFHGVNEKFGSFDVTPEVQEITDRLIKGVNSELEKIKILTHWVAEEIRYSGISMGEGEGYTLHKGEMTFADRCGVCKDKAGMLVTMLRAAGFESYPAMTMAGSRIDKIPADQFNHSVTVAKLKNGDWALLDPTWVPGVRELWSSAEQQQEFLLGIPGGADIMTTPVSPPENHYWKLKGESELFADGRLEGSLSLEAEGQSDAMIRRAFNRSYKSGYNEYLIGIMKAISPKAEIISQKFTDPYDISKPFKIEIKYKIIDYALITNDEIIFTPISAMNPFNDGYMSSELSMSTSPEVRNYGFRTRCSKLVEIAETIKLPSGMKVKSLPEFEEVDSEYSKFEAVYNKTGNSITFKANHVIGKRIFTPEDWVDFRKALIQRVSLSEKKIILNK